MAKKDLDVSGNITPTGSPHISKTDKEASKKLLDKFIDEETKLVKGRFKNHENKGCSAKIIVRKYPGIPVFEREMQDGEIYEIPLYVARHLQGVDVTAKAVGGRINTCAHGVHAYKTGKDDFPSKNLEEGMSVPIIFNKRYGFESLEFENAI